MRCLVVYCHPAETSFCAALHACTLAALKRAGHEVRDIDLYAEEFRPHLTRAEWLAYHDPAANLSGIERHVEAVLWAEALFFVYPTWWYGLPAMLKGWLDRALLPGSAFELPPDGAGAKPLLRHVRAVVAVTSMGSPRWWMALIGSPGRRLLLRGVRALCARRCKTLFLAHYAIDRSTRESRESFLAEVERRLSRLRA